MDDDLELTFSESDRSDDEQQRRRPLLRPRKSFEEEDFKERFRFGRDEFDDLLRELAPLIRPQFRKNHSLCERDRLLLALRFYAGGDFYYDIGDAHGPSKATVCRTIRLVCELRTKYLCRVPTLI